MNRRKELKYLFLIITIFIAACIETDIYLPAFPDMMVWFSASEGAIQSLLTWNFVGICIACPFYGPLSDSFGRKKPLVLALALFLLGSILTLFAQTLDQMLWGRILQGIGSGGCFTLGTAIVFDAFQKDRAINAVNKLNTIIPLIMAAAPMIGGYLNQSFGFRSNFLIIGIFVLISLIICLFFFDETLPEDKRMPFKFKKAVLDFKRAFTSFAFWQLTIAISLLFAGYIAFLSTTAVLFVVEFGLSKAIFPFVQAAILGGWVAGSLLLNSAIKKWGIPKVKKGGITLCVFGGFALFGMAFIAPQNCYLLTAAMIFYTFGANWMMGLYFPESMEILPDIKGITASLLTSFRLLIGALIIGTSSLLYNGTIYPLAFIIFATIVITLPTLIFYEKRQSRSKSQVLPSSTSMMH